MPHSTKQPSLDLDNLLEDCVIEVLKDEDPDRFLAWLQGRLGRYALGGQPDMFVDPAEHDRFALLLGRAIWNAMPLPGNGLRPRPLPEPGRNEPCFCGSELKYKRCCARTPAPPLEPEAVLPLVLERLPAQTLEREARSPRAPLDAIITAALRFADESKPGKAVKLLEPLFTGSGRKPDERMDTALNILCDQYDQLGHHRKKRSLLEEVTREAPRSPLRSGAWQRLAAMRMDTGDPLAAWQAFEAAQRDAPDTPALALLEIQLLMAEHRHDDARQRAAFWERRLRRRDEADDWLLDFLADAGEDPVRAMAAVGISASGGAGQGLADWLASVRDRPVPAYQAAAAGDEPGDAEMGKALAERLRGMGVAASEIDNAVEMLTEQLEELRLAPSEEAEPTSDETDEAMDSLHLVPPPEVAATEALWREVRPLDKPFSVNQDPFDDTDPWDPDHESEWMEFLAAHPEAFDSLDILDDLVSAVRRHPRAGWEGVDSMLAGPLLERAEAIVRHALRGAAGPRLAWHLTDNRVALRPIARLINLHLDQGREDEAGRLMSWLLELNPDDNHGFRSLLANHRLRRGDNEGVLALTDDYPSDYHPECAFGRVLALYRLGRLEDAADALTDAHQRLPKVAHALAAARLRRPAIDPHAVRLGGDDQAWLYREEIRDVWQATPGALEWLKQTAKRGG